MRRLLFSLSLKGPCARLATGALGLALAGCVGGSSEDARIADCRPSGSVPVLDLQIGAGDLDHLYTRSPDSNARLDAKAVWDDVGQSWHLGRVGVRFRGNSSRWLPKKSFNVRSEEGQALLFGSDRIIANAMYTDPSMVRDALAFGLFQRLGRLAPDTVYFDLCINGAYEGLYLGVERVDVQMLIRRGLASGTLVRDRFRQGADGDSVFGFPLSAEAAPLALLERSFDYRGYPDWRRLAELLLWVEVAEPDASFAEEFAERIDLPSFVDWLAIHILVGDTDSFADDYWLYLDHEDPSGRWVFIPWDKDLSFGSNYRDRHGVANDYFAYDLAPDHGWSNKLITLFFETEALAELLDQRLLELMEVLDAAYIAQRAEALAERIRGSVDKVPGRERPSRHLQNHHGELGRHRYHVEAIVDFVDLRYQFLKALLGEGGGDIYTAHAPIGPGSAEQPLFLTDGAGWVLGRLDFIEPPRLPGDLALSVERADLSVGGVDRVWTLRSTAGQFRARLTLYYRNDVDNNWYVGTPGVESGVVAVGEQWGLTLAWRSGNTFVDISEGRHVNAYSNKVVGEVSVQPFVDLELVLKYRDDPAAEELERDL